ncbi:phage virion morphogenesis protein [Meridianimarinicoccus sp. RP-17]|uniref:phage virion morphogenesis protein n=1 Tax=Meridianimarinicoccus zhengii TaxID=2056810 RepID=UPI000DAF1FF3|nr:phage virion morphogenesis protein [Phycocomes zhengii]
MVGVAYTLESRSLDQALDGLARWSGSVAQRRLRLADAIGALLESSVKRRIAEEKEAPDGTPWAPWSERHGATRRTGQTILQAEGDLLDSVQSLTSAAEVQTGSNLVYAAIHQFGGEDVDIDIPERPYLGLSTEDERGVRDLAADFLRGGLA